MTPQLITACNHVGAVPAVFFIGQGNAPIDHCGFFWRKSASAMLDKFSGIPELQAIEYKWMGDECRIVDDDVSAFEGGRHFQERALQKLQQVDIVVVEIAG